MPADRRVAILHLEDTAADAKLVAAALAKDQLDCDITVVDNEAAFTRAIETGAYDLVLSDHSLPSFDGLDALRIVRSRRPDLPFISVSGAFGEEVAAEVVRAGATDYVLKHRLSRLGAAVRRALAEAEERARRAQAEAEVQRLGDRLRHAQRLEAIGRVAGGVAHDFNNLLMVINGYTERLIRQLPPGHEWSELVAPIASAGQRGSELTQRLLAFSRHQVLAPRVVSANDILREMLPMLKPIVGEQVRLSLTLDPRAGAINVDPVQLEQVVMNLVTNARDAMPAGGALTVETRNVTIGDEHGGLPPGAYVEIVVRDTGHGIDPDQQVHIFEPFFTTKERGRGTGLGLPMAYGIVSQSGGEIRVDSVVGAGTAMRIRLPLAGGAPVQAPAPVAPGESDAPGGKETLLLVEDDESVRDLVREFLRGAGYRVIEAGDAVEAEAKCRTEHGRIDLLVSDVVLPGLDGPSLAERLRTMVPGLRTLLMSGYPGGATVRPSAESGTTFVAKPFSRATLLTKVRQALS
jgi:signal transduction histidine kinase